MRVKNNIFDISYYQTCLKPSEKRINFTEIKEENQNGRDIAAKQTGCKLFHFYLCNLSKNEIDKPDVEIFLGWSTGRLRNQSLIHCLQTFVNSFIKTNHGAIPLNDEIRFKVLINTLNNVYFIFNAENSFKAF